MTSFRMTDNDQYLVRQVLKDMEKFQPVGQHILNRTNIIEVKPALMFDSVYALAEGLHSLQQGMDLRPANVSCEEEVPWTDGSSLFNYINSVEFLGLTGKVQFKEGRRSSVKFDLLKLRETSLEKVGEWTTGGSLNITNHKVFHEFGTTNITLKVTTIEILLEKTDRGILFSNARGEYSNNSPEIQAQKNTMKIRLQIICFAEPNLSERETSATIAGLNVIRKSRRPVGQNKGFRLGADFILELSFCIFQPTKINKLIRKRHWRRCFCYGLRCKALFSDFRSVAKNTFYLSNILLENTDRGIPFNDARAEYSNNSPRIQAQKNTMKIRLKIICFAEPNLSERETSATIAGRNVIRKSRRPVGKNKGFRLGADFILELSFCIFQPTKINKLIRKRHWRRCFCYGLRCKALFSEFRM
ncbi:glutamate receptor, ionotropic kainate 2-like protein [Caerostris darwini]|uniref:Glutamate receptor, ionotropic kainate 2-like protein n=1 Tax=Caerostris darwini TaxID=1538125 RepID=A0AAV4WXU1_9ARAC|nr:glutamate receptor, ionotropic kainate 2-like protein [Caerostris darwini]